MDAADKAPQTGAHLLLAHDRKDERPTFEELETRSYRATWLPRELSPQYGTAQFRTAVDRVLEFEESWRGRVRPEIDSPLLLPETAFKAEQSVKDVWSRARKVDQQRDRLDAVEKTINRFRDRHRKRDGWHDNNRLVFERGTPHGGHALPGWRKRKLTRQLPPGFHFDVKHERSGPFQVFEPGRGDTKIRLLYEFRSTWLRARRSLRLGVISVTAVLRADAASPRGAAAPRVSQTACAVRGGDSAAAADPP